MPQPTKSRSAPLKMLVDAFAEQLRQTRPPNTARQYISSLRGLLRDHLSDPVAWLDSGQLNDAFAQAAQVYSSSRVQQMSAAYTAFRDWAGEQAGQLLPARRKAPPIPEADVDLPDEFKLAAVSLFRSLPARSITQAAFLALRWGVIYERGNGPTAEFLLPMRKGTLVLRHGTDGYAHLKNLKALAADQAAPTGPLLPREKGGATSTPLTVFRAWLREYRAP